MSSEHTKDTTVLFRYSLYTALVGAVIGFFLLLFDGANFRLDTPAFWSAILFGSMIALCQVFTFYALNITTVALTNMCNTASVLIPTLFGIIVFQEDFTIGTGIGIVLFFAAAYLISTKNNAVAQQKPFTAKTLFACLLVFLSNGFGSVSMQLFSHYSKGVSESGFMFYTYLFTSVILGVFVMMLLWKRKKQSALPTATALSGEENQSQTANHEKTLPIFSKILFLWGALSTAIGFFINQVNTIIAPHIPAAILFPSLKGGALLMGVLVGWTIFKEKLSVKNIIGVVLCIAALIVLNLL
jgi:drug/metabolite transporter (DMT)-like permease